MNTTLPLLRRVLADSWRALLGWSLGITAAIMLYVPLFSSIGGNSQMAQLLETLPKGLVEALNYDAISTGPGYVQSTFYGLVGFAVIVIASTVWGAAVIAGDEESGSLELTLAHGVTRTRLVIERTLAVILRLLWLAALSVVLVLALDKPVGLGITPEYLVATSAALLGLGLLSASVGIAVGAITGRSAYATAAGAGVAIVGYALNAVAHQNSDLDALHTVSPYYWAYGRSPLVDGVDWAGLGLLYGCSALLIAIAVIALNRRDIAG